jgi:uncharacterized protein RhaS with RHS repeats
LDYFGARYYLSAYGRWGSVDPLREKHAGWSPYAYVLGNPLKLVDPDGRQVAAITGTCCMELMTFEKAGDQYLRRRDQFQLQREQGSYLKAAATLVWAPIELGLNVLGAADPVGLMGGVSAVGMADDAARVLSQADDLARAAAKQSIGFAPGTAENALSGLRSGGGHAIRHLEGSIIPNTGSLQSRLDAFKEIAIPILENPLHSVDWRIGSTQGRAFVGNVNGYNVAIVVAKEGPYKGKVISSFIPDENQLFLMKNKR